MEEELDLVKSQLQVSMSPIMPMMPMMRVDPELAPFSLTEMEKTQLGIPAYARYIEMIRPQPDLERLISREMGKAAAESESKMRRLEAADRWARSQRVRAVRSGALLKAVTRAALVADHFKRGLALAEESSARVQGEARLGTGSGSSLVARTVEGESLRDLLAQVNSVWDGLSTCWISAALTEYGVAEVRSEAYANSPFKFHIMSDCPFEKHTTRIWHDTTYTSYWRTRNPILQNSYARPPASNVMGTPLIAPLETPEMIERRLSHTDVHLDPRWRGAVAGVALITTKALRVEDEIAEHKATGTAMERRDRDRERIAAVSAVKEWLAREATGGVRPQGGLSSFLRRYWGWIAAIAILSALAAFLFLPSGAKPPPTNLTNATSQIKNATIVNNTLIVFGLLRVMGMGVP